MNCFITTYLTGSKDPQRGGHWEVDDFTVMGKYYNSVTNKNIPLYILHYDLGNDFINKWSSENVTFIKVKKVGLNLVDDRWKLYNEFLKNRTDLNLVFLTDISDVVVLNNPFSHMNSCDIYCGDEQGAVCESKWLTSRYKMINNEDINSRLQKYKNDTRLNAGLLGGDRKHLCDIAEKINKHLFEWKITDKTVDMVALNDVLRIHYKDKICHGFPVNTPFKSHNMEITNAWFRHK